MKTIIKILVVILLGNHGFLALYVGWMLYQI
jgi:hypothetical protein